MLDLPDADADAPACDPLWVPVAREPDVPAVLPLWPVVLWPPAREPPWSVALPLPERVPL